MHILVNQEWALRCRWNVAGSDLGLRPDGSAQFAVQITLGMAQVLASLPQSRQVALADGVRRLIACELDKEWRCPQAAPP